MAGPLLDDLDDEQRAAATAVTGPVCIVAGAGTGKTRTVTYRLAHGIRSGAVEARQALAITHSRKAAAELKERLGRLGVGDVDARTFHAAGLRVASQFWDRTGRSEPAPSVLSDSDSWRMWRDCLRSVSGHDPDNGAVRDIADEVAWARSRLIAPAAYATAAEVAGRKAGIDASTVVKCWDGYLRAKARVGRVDFADLLEISADLMRADIEVAEAVRERWRHVTVDEYQDTDPAQQRFLDAIVGEGRDLCVVGDPRQAIYSWKGADPSYLTGFARRYPDALVFDLSRNYRSTPQILGWANRLAGERGTKPLAATRPGGPNPKVTQLDSETGEASWVAGAARRAIAAGTPVSEIAVLYRFNATQARLEAAFARVGIPTVVAEDLTFFDRPEIRSVLTTFGQVARAQPDQDGMELLGTVLARAGFDRDRPPPGLGAARSRWESQSALLDLLEATVEEEAVDAVTLLAQVNKLATSSLGPRDQGVTLATLHKAKGLEWDVVFVVGVTDGALPSSFADTPEQLAEEERLLHVGVTRARRELHLTWSATSSRGWANRPSPFLDLLTDFPALAPAARRTSGARPAERTKANGPRRGSRDQTRSDPGGPFCPHCADPLKGVSARRLGICADCVTSAPGDTGRLARALSVIVEAAAAETGIAADKLLSPAGLMRLLERRPDRAEVVMATTGVEMPPMWCQEVAEALQD